MPSALVVDSLIGPLRLESADSVALTAIRFDGRSRSEDPVDAAAEVLREAAAQLASYFAGTLRVFDLPLAPRGPSSSSRSGASWPRSPTERQ